MAGDFCYPAQFAAARFGVPPVRDIVTTPRQVKAAQKNVRAVPPSGGPSCARLGLDGAVH